MLALVALFGSSCTTNGTFEQPSSILNFCKGKRTFINCHWRKILHKTIFERLLIRITICPGLFYFCQKIYSLIHSIIKTFLIGAMGIYFVEKYLVFLNPLFRCVLWILQFLSQVHTMHLASGFHVENFLSFCPSVIPSHILNCYLK